MTLQQLDKEFSNSNLGALLYSIETGIVESNNLTPQQIVELKIVLENFVNMFKVPSQLRPARSHDQKIPIIPGSNPPSIKPYHYSSVQKDEIEKAV